MKRRSFHHRLKTEGLVRFGVFHAWNPTLEMLLEILPQSFEIRTTTGQYFLGYVEKDGRVEQMLRGQILVFTLFRV